MKTLSSILLLLFATICHAQTTTVITPTNITGVITGNGFGLTNLQSTNIVGLVAGGGIATSNGVGTNLTVYGTLTSTNLNALYDTNNAGIAAALLATNGLVIPPFSITNGFIVLKDATNVAAAMTNGFIALSDATNVVHGMTNGAIPSTNGFVDASITNGLATTNWVISNFDTNNAGIAAALVATNNFGTTVPVTLTNAANSFNGSFAGSGNFDISTNLIPAGATYDTNTGYYFLEGGAVVGLPNTFLLQRHGTYLLTFGTNEFRAYSYASGIMYLPAQSPVLFTYNWIVAHSFRLTSVAGSGPVTATLCYIIHTNNLPGLLPQLSTGDGSGLTNAAGNGYVDYTITNGWIGLVDATNVANASALAATNGSWLSASNLVVTATNGSWISASNLVFNATNNYVGGVTLGGVSNVVAAYTNVLASTNYVNAATNNFGNSVAVTMTNKANSFSGTFNPLTNRYCLFNITNAVSATNTTFAHGLSFTPRIYPVLLCITNDAASGITVGEEISVDSVLISTTGSVRSTTINCGADGTNIYLNFGGSAANNTFTTWNGSSSKAFTSFSNFQVKVYY